MSVQLFNRKWPTPIILDPVGSQRAFHDDGEVAVARAAKTLNHLQILSTVATTSVEEVTKERGAPIWYQLYDMGWEGNLEMIKRAEDVDSEALVFTVDLAGGTNNRESLKRMMKLDTRTCTNCHTEKRIERKPMVANLKESRYEFEQAITWDYVDKLRAATKMKFLIKGIETAEDARLCLEHKVDGIIISNHGGRASETGRGTMECLPEIVNVVKGRIPVLIDGGFRRGTDIFKALALGADAICIGRPYIWGLASFGQEGVEAVLKILTDELSLTMIQAGTPSIGDIDKSFIA